MRNMDERDFERKGKRYRRTYLHAVNELYGSLMANPETKVERSLPDDYKDPSLEIIS